MTTAAGPFLLPAVCHRYCIAGGGKWYDYRLLWTLVEVLRLQGYGIWQGKLPPLLLGLHFPCIQALPMQILIRALHLIAATLHCRLWCFPHPDSTAQCRTALAEQHSTAQHSKLQQTTAQHSTANYSTAHSTLQHTAHYTAQDDTVDGSTNFLFFVCSFVPAGCVGIYVRDTFLPAS
jgi:hypothetical protein